ncbi:probable pectinesterase 29 [Brassica napus]|uniref:probable pectinesterase 29 n=1 Tax=Brassica napus TaxID=3708 RepID=UPI00207A21E1|nr:probable pectinesterase 29 [Brassica napus]
MSDRPLGIQTDTEKPADEVQVKYWLVEAEGKAGNTGDRGGNRRVETLRRPPEAGNREAESRRRSRRKKRKERKKNSFNGDKCAFYSVGFSEVQDTLWDADGRHFFHRCTIQGAVDFIFGNGQSIYKVLTVIFCLLTLNVLGATLKPGVAGYITAPGRTNPYDASGFVFTDYLVHGTGKAFLGRPWCSYARVIFYNTDLSDVVVPQGWDSWHFGGHVSQLTFAEIGCYGSGSNTGRRVSWVKKLSGFCVQSMIRLAFINSGGWVQALPIPV